MAQTILDDVPATPRPEVQGVRSLDQRGARVQKATVAALTVIPFAGVLWAMTSLWGSGLSGLDATLFGGFYVLSGLGITVGYHRLFTHRSFETSRGVRVMLAVLGSIAIEGSVITWVADHRRHHAYSDKDGDPHSPHLDEGDGLVGVLRGLWHAHMGWLFNDERTSWERWAPDLLKDPALVKVDSAFPRLILVSFGLPALIGGLVTGTFGGALSGFVWGGLVRVFLLHHVTWSVNSVCHFFGKRPYNTTDYSTNNWALSLISFGESWHNNHHAFPTSAVHGLGRAQIDLSAMVIRGFERLGLARNVKVVSAKQETKALKADG